MPQVTYADASENNITMLTFDNKEQYHLFLDYLNQSKINSMRDEPAEKIQTLADFYLEKNDDSQFRVTFKRKWGTESVVSKFMEVTRMMEMDYSKFMITFYQADENQATFPLGRQGNATIGSDVLKKMQQYRKNVTSLKDQPVKEESVAPVVVPKKTEETKKQPLPQDETHSGKTPEDQGIIDKSQEKSVAPKKIETPQVTYADASENNITALTFANKEQYHLFLDYLNQSKINGMRDEPAEKIQTLADFYLEKNDDSQFRVTFKRKWGTESVVSKFMEVTRMMEMDYSKFMITFYQPDENQATFPLGRQGDATIGSDVMIKMQQYRKNVTALKGQPVKEEPVVPKKSQEESIAPVVVPKKIEETIKQILPQYEAHLRQKLVNEGIVANISSNINISLIRQECTLTPKQQKLLNRYEAISSVYSDIKNKPSLDEKDLLAVKAAVVTCQDNKPAWSERSFLQKLTDILSLGLIPMYRSFFSKEKQFEKELQELQESSTSTPK